MGNAPKPNTRKKHGKALNANAKRVKGGTPLQGAGGTSSRFFRPCWGVGATPPTQITKSPKKAVNTNHASAEQRGGFSAVLVTPASADAEPQAIIS